MKGKRYRPVEMAPAPAKVGQSDKQYETGQLDGPMKYRKKYTPNKDAQHKRG